MSAPLVINTKDGACWTRRTVTAGGIALYALADVCQCPEIVMATLAELAEHGIVGSADALPMPAGPAPQTGPRSFDLVGEVMADDYDDAVYAAEQAYSGMRGQGYKGSISVDTGSGQPAAEADGLELPETALGRVQAILLMHFAGGPRSDMAVGLLLTNLRAEWEAESQSRVVDLEAAPGEALRRTVSWRLEVQENGCWWDCGQSADSYPAAQDLLARERAEKPGIGFRLVCRTTTDTLPAEAGEPS